MNLYFNDYYFLSIVFFVFGCFFVFKMNRVLRIKRKTKIPLIIIYLIATLICFFSIVYLVFG
ncbi:hypothetical protein B4O97_18785 [Marispirochaeta aestuarii]|uniref:Uncharacterized protein n=1 Tax=Marispirochaeta aestuarii TaxID=1963862 RepID=A0A1Y1RSX5_9SPIO|nr:hypothetical protein B4O97_18785 [Marispirochaeta aestuarii]